MSTINEVDNNKINYFKKIYYKKGKKEDLSHKYFYKLNLSPKKVNIFQLMENGLANQDEFEQVDNVCTKAINHKNELEKKQIECLKSMILHHKQIPEKWIIQSNYKDMLNKAMSDPIVLSYAIESKEIFKKRSTSVSLDISEIEKNLRTSTTVPKFISYINPYSRNYENSIKKHKLMREYCYNVKNKKNRIQQNIKNLRNINFTENSDNEIKKEDKKNYLNTDGNKDNILPYIYPNLKDFKKKNKKKNKEHDKEETFMMTSLYYDENKLSNENKEKKDNKKKINKDNTHKDNKDNKDNKDIEDNKENQDDQDNSNMNNDSINSKNNDISIKRKSIELPMIE